MTKSPKTRVSDTTDLEQRIDRLQLAKNQRRAKAAEMDQEAEKLLKTYCANRPGDDAQLAWQMGNAAKHLKNKATRLRLSASTDKRLLYLKQKLAELRTSSLPGVMPDDSVSV